VKVKDPDADTPTENPLVALPYLWATLEAPAAKLPMYLT
jgi:hypothetical protein